MHPFRQTSRRTALCGAWICAVALGAVGDAATAQASPGAASIPASPPSVEGEARAKAQVEAMATLTQKDPELANHLGFFATGDPAAAKYPKLVAAANILSSVCGRRITPESLDALAVKENLYSENLYGARSVLAPSAFCRLLSLGSGGRYSVSLESRVAGRVPDDEAREAEASPDLFVILAYLDRVPMIENRFAWGPDGTMLRVSVANPLASAASKVPQYKTKAEYSPEAFDVWEFYRFKKSIK